MGAKYQLKIGMQYAPFHRGEKRPVPHRRDDLKICYKLEISTTDLNYITKITNCGRIGRAKWAYYIPKLPT